MGPICRGILRAGASVGPLPCPSFLLSLCKVGMGLEAGEGGVGSGIGAANTLDIKNPVEHDSCTVVYGTFHSITASMRDLKSDH